MMGTTANQGLEELRQLNSTLKNILEELRTANANPQVINILNENPHEQIQPCAAAMVDYQFEAMDLEEAVGQALGAASTCWEDMSGTGIFQSERAKNIYDQIIKRIRAAGPIYN